MELLSGLECGRSNFVILLALQFLCKTEATTTSTNQEFCFHQDREGSSHLQPFKNESWQTTSLGELLQQMLQCYDSRVRVEHGGRGNPTTVVVSLYILSIGNFQVRDMDFQLSFYFRQQWQDSRLAYGNHFHEEKITLGGGILEQLWLPQTYFVNKKGSSTSVDANFFVRIFPDGSLLVITKNTLTMDCYMDLRNFPFDVQKCNLTIESFGFTTKDVVYKWISSKSTEAVEQDPGLTTSEFDIGPIRIFESASMYKTGLFSSLKMELNFQRRSVYYLIQIYIPSGMIVVLSWISFWIDNQSIPARTALGITTVLAMTTLLFGVQSSLPSVPYIKAVDLFMIVSFANVFAALVEFAVVNYTSMREKERKESKPSKNTKNKYTVNPDIVMLNFRNLSYENDAGNEHHLQNGVTQNGVFQNGVTQNGVTQNGAIVNNIRNSLHKRDVQTSNGTVGEHSPAEQTFLSRDYPHVQEPPYKRPNRCRWRCKITANAIDAWSRVLFPLAYGLFIVAYWIIYSSANTDKKSQ